MEFNYMDVQEKLRKEAVEFSKKVAPIYKLLNWEWGDCGVPSQQNILKVLNKLIDEFPRYTNKKEPYKINYGTGGLCICGNNDEMYEFKLKFECDSKTVYYDKAKGKVISVM